MTQLSKNFTLAEVCYSDTAIAKKINNTPSGTHLNNMKDLVTKFLQPLRDEIGLPIKVNSGYRSEALNRAIPGSSTTSAHCYGWAVDIVCPKYGNARKFSQYVADFCKRKGIKYDQILLEYDSWCHFGLKNRAGQQRGELRVFTRGQPSKLVTKFV